MMSSILYGQYWIILFLLAGLVVKRRYISRIPVGAVTLVIARLLFRSVLNSPDLNDDRTLFNILGWEWLILGLNILAIVTLFFELIFGYQRWQIRRIERAKKRSERIKPNNN